MRFSIIITCYNQYEFIRDALESVLSQVQDCDEVIVVDDGSRDGSLELLRLYEDSVRLLALPANRGAAILRPVPPLQAAPNATPRGRREGIGEQSRATGRRTTNDTKLVSVGAISPAPASPFNSASSRAARPSRSANLLHLETRLIPLAFLFTLRNHDQISQRPVDR